MYLDGTHDLIGSGFDLAHSLGPDIGDKWPFLDVVGKDSLPARLINGGVNIGKKDHPVDRLYVLVDDRVIERLAGLRAYVDSDRVLFDALVTDDTDAGDSRRRLRTDALRRNYQRQQQKNRMDHAL